MAAVRYTDQQRTDATALATEVGVSEAARRVGVDKATISRWCKAAGVATLHTESTAAAVDAKRLAWEERRTDLAHEQGRIAAKALELTEQCLDRRKFSDARAAATTMAILTDKAQLLTGAATSRSEHSVSPERALELRDKVRHLRAA